MKERLIDFAGETTYYKGVEYYADNKVSGVHQLNENEYEAEVSGTETYHVVLNTKDITLSTCTCPFHKDGNRICKHIVAVYVSLNPDIAKEDIEKYKSITEKLNNYRRFKGYKNIVNDDSVSGAIKEEKKEKKKYIPIEPISEDIEVSAEYDGVTFTYKPYLVGKRLTELRQKQKMSRQQLADEMDVDRQTVEMWEAGKELPDMDDLNYIAFTLLDSSFEYLIFGDDDYDMYNKENDYIEDEDDDADDEEDIDDEEPVEIELSKRNVTHTTRPVVHRKNTKRNVAIATRIIVTIFYSPIWLCVGVLTFFLILPAPWHLFRKRVEPSLEEKLDEYLLEEEEFYDIMEED